LDRGKIEQAVKMILEAIGEDPKNPALAETPARVARAYEEIFSGINRDAAKELKTTTGIEYDEIILVKDIPLYSICEHHFLPFYGKAHVGYISQGGRITGLSKLARVVEILSRRLQTQERLTTEIANVIMEKLEPRGVIVIIEAEHLCMSMRGIQKPGTFTMTSAVRGIFKKNEKTRAEAIALIRSNRKS
jgi:GTP cyclohydrolase I